MSDRREIILAHLFTTLSAIPGVHTKHRNRGVIPDDKRPAIILLDGSESVVSGEPPRGRAFPAMPPAIVRMTPQIFAILEQRKTVANEGVGQELNEYRVKIIKAIKDDNVLRNLLGPNGQIRYISSETDLETGSSLEGQLQINFALDYVLNPAEL